MRFPGLRRGRGNTNSSGGSDETTSVDASLFLWEYRSTEEQSEDLYGLVETVRTPPDQGATGRYQATSEQSSGVDDREEASDTPSAADESTYEPGSERIDAAPARVAALAPVPEDAQTRYLRYNLDAAVVKWRTSKIVASPALTQRAMAALAAGTSLAEDHLTLLLRSAIRYRKGALTALKYQDDPERTALVLVEELTLIDKPISLEVLLGLRDKDPQGLAWFGALLSELHDASAGTDPRIRRRAIEVLWRLQGDVGASHDHGRPAPWLVARRFGLAAALLLAGCVVAVAMLALFRDREDLATLSAGTYILIDGNGTRVGFAADGFDLHTHEVTNREYRRCVESGNCEPPKYGAAADILDYFTNRTYDSYPVVNVTVVQAERFCNARGMQLPTAEEWTLASSVAPASGNTLIYPWGMTVDVQRANTADLGLGAPTSVGNFSPAGDSSIGAADMAGNVAEWTATTRDDGAARVVKGGSYRQTSEDGIASAEIAVQTEWATDWIGFRCIKPREAR